MPVRPWHAAVLVLALVLGVSACTSNYKFNDNEYRPLGDPQAVNRGK
ncbi:type VI secretion protein [Pseudomonas sp. MWU13-2100]|nr:type VI secretion protein [Pseudomonas sp. MWU13-2100]